jgi:nitrite reductase/ring-hydroxylating ferredoxin subunit
MGAFIKLKVEASGMPSWVRTDEDWEAMRDRYNTDLGITLEKSKMIKNPGRKQLAKLMLNSLWGKFAQRANYMQHKTLTNPKEFRDFERRWDDGNIAVKYRSEMTDEMFVLYDESQEDEDSKKNIAIAAFVTAYGRLRLWAEMEKLGSRVIYHDTDSIIYERDPLGYNIPNGRYLGEWEDECGGAPITGFVSTGPKTYAYRYIKNGAETYACKAKGFTLNSTTVEEINFNGMHALIVGDKHYLEAVCPHFQYDRDKGMVSYNMHKVLKWSYDKGAVMDDYSILPKGYDQFPQHTQRQQLKRPLVVA